LYPLIYNVYIFHGNPYRSDSVYKRVCVTLLTHTKTGSRLSPTVFSCSRDESGNVITFTTQLNKTADCAKNVQNSLTVSSFVLKVITSPDATQLNKNSFIELSRVGRCDRGLIQRQ